MNLRKLPLNGFLQKTEKGVRTMSKENTKKYKAERLALLTKEVESLIGSGLNLEFMGMHNMEVRVRLKNPYDPSSYMFFLLSDRHYSGNFTLEDVPFGLIWPDCDPPLRQIKIRAQYVPAFTKEVLKSAIENGMVSIKRTEQWCIEGLEKAQNRLQSQIEVRKNAESLIAYLNVNP
jgi:hypothetical protein